MPILQKKTAVFLLITVLILLISLTVVLFATLPIQAQSPIKNSSSFKLDEQHLYRVQLMNTTKVEELSNTVSNDVGNDNNSNYPSLEELNKNITGVDNGWTVLHEASKFGYLHIVKQLLSRGEDVNRKAFGEQNYTPLQLAAINGNNDIVRELLMKGADIQAVNTDGSTALHEASKYGNVKVVEELLSRGANVNTTTIYSLHYTPLQLAAMGGNIEVVRELLMKGADIHALNSHGWSALHEASKHGHDEVVEELLLRGANVNKKTIDDIQYTPLHLASLNGHPKVVNILIMNGAQINDGNVRGWTALHEASSHGFVQIVIELLNRGAEINKKTVTDKQSTPLQLASMNGHSEVVHTLLSEDADSMIRNREGWIALHEASYYGHLQIVQELLSKGNDVNIQCIAGKQYTPLQLASIKGHLEVAKEMISRGALINLRNREGWTALHESASSGQLNVTQLLLSMGAEINSKTIYHKQYTPLQLAIINGFVEVASLLLLNNADVHIGNIDGWTALHEAANYGHHQIAQQLISKGALVNIKSITDKQYTPLQIASMNGHLGVVKVLLSNKANLHLGNKDGWTALHESSSHGHDMITAELLSKGSKINQKTVTENQVTALQLASMNGHLKVVKVLFTNGADLEVGNINGYTALHEASKAGHTPVVKFLLACGVDINKKTVADVHYSALQLASIFGRTEVVKELLLSGADPFITNADGWSSLHECSHHGHHEVAVELLLRGSHINRKTVSANQYTPLQLATMAGHFKVVKELLLKGADVSMVNFDGWTALHEASNYGHVNITRALLASGADVNSRSVADQRYTPLQIAAMKGHFTTIEELIKNDADIHLVNMDGWSAIHEASRHGHTNIVNELLGRGANINSKTVLPTAYTPLHLAAIYDHLDVVLALLSRGADFETANREGWTALHEASKNNRRLIVQVLLANGANINKKVISDKQYTPLLIAVANGHLDVVKELLSNGALTDICDKDGWSPLHVATQSGYYAISLELLLRGADINAKYTIGNQSTPLHLAAINGHLDIIKMLVVKGAEVNKVNRYGWTALHEASKNGNYLIVQHLLLNGADVNKITTNKKFSALQLSAIHGQEHIFQELMANKADVVVGNKNNWKDGTITSEYIRKILISHDIELKPI